MALSIHQAASVQKSQTLADSRLLDQRRRAGLAHQLVAASAGRATRQPVSFVEHAFADQLDRAEIAGPVQKAEVEVCRAVASFKQSLSPNALKLLDAAWEVAQFAEPGEGVACGPSDAATLLGSIEAGRCAHAELISRGLLRPNVIGAMGYCDGFRVVLP